MFSPGVFVLVALLAPSSFGSDSTSQAFLLAPCDLVPRGIAMILFDQTADATQTDADTSQPETPRSEQSLRIIRNVRYANTDNPRQQLDLVLPSESVGDSPLPVVVLIHGGAWRQGSRHGYLGRAKAFARTGRYAAATIGYRLSQEAKWPAQIHDCKAAVRWLRANAEEYNLDTKRFAAGGGSAGGHLAAMLGLTGDGKTLEGSLGEHDDQSSRVQVVLDRYGPTELLSMNDAPGKMDHNAANSPESQLVGGPIQKHADRAKSASPTSYVSADDPPFLILHGAEDVLVPADQSERLVRLLKKQNLEVRLKIYENSGHGLKGVEGLFEEELRFLDRHFYGNTE